MSWTRLGITFIRLLATVPVLFAVLIFAHAEDIHASSDDLDAAAAQLRERLVNIWVLVRIDMPASEDGIDVRLWQQPTVDAEETQTRIEKHGVSIASYGQLSVITDIKIKRKHLEVHLDGGGWGGRIPNVPWWVDRSAEEIALGLPRLRPYSATERRQRTAFVEERAREDDRAYDLYMKELEEYERSKNAAGSRFNLRYRHTLTADELTPESVMNALGIYIDFGVY